MLGGLLAAPVLARTSERLLVGSGLLACALSCLAATTGRSAGAGGSRACPGYASSGSTSARSRWSSGRRPARLLGRVDAAANVLVTVPQAISIALGAAAIAVLDYRILLAVMAAVMLAAAGYLAACLVHRCARRQETWLTASDRVQRIETIPCDVRYESTREAGWRGWPTRR